MRVAFQRAAVGAASFCQWRRGPRLSGHLAADPGPAERRRPLFDRHDRRRLFLVGLGLGSRLGGRGSLRVSPRGALRAFAALDIGLGVFGSVSASFYYDVLTPLAVALRRALAGGRAASEGLLLPTALMGMSLPLLTGDVRVTAAARAHIGVLFGVNLLGAASSARSRRGGFLRPLGCAARCGSPPPAT